MKIRNEQLRALQENELQRAKTQKNAGEFTELFNQEVQAEPAQGLSGAAVPSHPLQGVAGGPLGIQNPALLEVQASLETSVAKASSMMEEAALAMDGMFSTLDSYADQLALDGKADLRQAYSLLENLNGQISNLKSRFPGMAQEQPGLAALVNELDVLATTESFKFNRGDYL